MSLDQIAQRAVDEVHDAHREARFTSTAPQARRSVVTPVILGVAFSLLAIVGIAFLANEPGDRAFTGPQSEPERPAEVIVFLSSDTEVGVAGPIAIEVAGWPGVEFAAPWDSERALAEFEELFADQPSLIEIVREDPSILPVSVRIWIDEGVDADALADRARSAFPEAFQVSTGEDRAETLAREVTESPTTTQAEEPRYDNPWNLSLQGATAYQLGILGDDQLTFEEYDGAVDAMVKCIRDKDVFITDPAYSTAFRQFEYLVGATSTLEEADPAEAVWERCYREFVDVVETAWVIQNAPSEEEAQAYRSQVAACLRARGFDVPEHPSHAELFADFTEIMRIQARGEADLIGCFPDGGY